MAKAYFVLTIYNEEESILPVVLSIADCTPLARFGNNVPDDEIFDIDINLGRMLLPSFYRLRQLGKNVYLYDGKTCANAVW